MKLLAYDTSSGCLSAALFDGERKVAEFRSPSFTKHSILLVPVLERLLRKCRWRADALDCVAVGIGPGSFTGLRVGVTTAKFLSYAGGARLVGVSSLEVLAAQAKADDRETIAVMRDARKGMVYAALYKKDRRGVPRVIQAPRLVSAARFLEQIKGPVVWVGEGVFPRAADLGRIALERIRRKKFADPFKLEPLYLHPRDCNVTLAKTHKYEREVKE